MTLLIPQGPGLGRDPSPTPAAGLIPLLGSSRCPHPGPRRHRHQRRHRRCRSPHSTRPRPQCRQTRPLHYWPRPPSIVGLSLDLLVVGGLGLLGSVLAILRGGLVLAPVGGFGECRLLSTGLRAVWKITDTRLVNTPIERDMLVKAGLHGEEKFRDNLGLVEGFQVAPSSALKSQIWLSIWPPCECTLSLGNSGSHLEHKSTRIRQVQSETHPYGVENKHWGERTLAEGPR